LWNTVKQSQGFDDVWFYHCDHLGTPQEMSDQTGAIVWKAQYKAWGECKVEQAKSDFFENSEIISNNIRFQGQYYDGETGLHYNRYRYYSPYVGRFISKDPIGLLGGYNHYQYGPNPISWVDPTGLNFKSVGKIKEERARRQTSSSAPYIKHTMAKCKTQAQNISKKEAQYWDMSKCESNVAQVTAFRNRLEKEGLNKGYKVDLGDNKGSHYYIYDAGRNIGFNEGKETQYMRIEVSSTNEFHGHPISKQRYESYMKKAVK
jgi:RHS repeat-associated protein